MNTRIGLRTKACVDCRKSKVPWKTRRCTGECRLACCVHIVSPSGVCWPCVRKDVAQRARVCPK